MIRPCHLAALMAALLLPGAAAADSTQNSQLANSILLTTGMLAVVIACFIGLAWLTRRLQTSHFRRSRSLQLIESLPVGRNEKICIIKAGSTFKVIGVTSQQITLMETLESLEQVNTTTAEDPKNQAWKWAQQFLQSNTQ
ncbi:flagellar biosynthetic protein FliO [Endozoicomonas montiporae]|nr:flagellar biosynthetic protein FliO [Endozoicomonas montiporae]